MPDEIEWTPERMDRLSRAVCALKRREVGSSWTCPAWIMNEAEVCPECASDAERVADFIDTGLRGKADA